MSRHRSLFTDNCKNYIKKGVLTTRRHVDCPPNDPEELDSSDSTVLPGPSLEGSSTLEPFDSNARGEL